MKVLDTFCGVGGIKQGFTQAGFDVVQSVDFDKACKTTFDANYNDEMVLGDISELPPESYPDHDVLVGGFPCQAFSVAGYRKGFNEKRGTLFFNLADILHVKQPRAFMFENVKGLAGHDGGNTLEVILRTLRQDLGYYVPDPKVLNSWDYGCPQNRERIFIVGFKEKNNFEFPDKQDHSGDIWSILDDNVDPKYEMVGPFNEYLSEDECVIEPNQVYQKRFNYVRKHSNPRRSPTLVTGMTPTFIRDPKTDVVRRLTPAECFRVQGFKDFVIPEGMGDTQLYKQAGNSVSVPVIKAVADSMWKALS
jgi:DNA (cytosine-5)-methyltransferase 1